MKSIFIRLSSLLLVAALVISLTACGDDEPAVSTPDTTTTTTESTDAIGDATTDSTAPIGDTSATDSTTGNVTTTTGASKTQGTKPTKAPVETPSSAPKYPTFKNEAGTVMAKIDTVKGQTVSLLCVDYAQFDEGGSASTYLKKYYGITVNQKRMPNANIGTEFTTAYLSGKPYDLVTDTQVFPQYVTQNVIEPLTNRIDFTIPEIAENKAVFDAYTYAGDNYFLPWMSSAMSLIYFNKEVFEDANLDLDGDGKKGDDPYSLYAKGTWTWDAFKRAAKQLNRTNKNGEVMVYGLLAREWTDSRIVYISGQTLTKTTGGKVVSNLNNSDYQRIYNEYVNLINNDKVVKRGDDAIYTTFNNGGGAMLLGPSYMTTGEYFKTIFADQNVGLAPMPKDNKSSTHYVPGQAYGFWVSKGGFYRNGKFNTDLLNAFINGTVISSSDQGKPGTAAYKTARANFVNKWKSQNRRFTEAWYDKYIAMQETLDDHTTPLVDAYSDCMNISQVLDVMTGWGEYPPETFAAAVNRFEGGLKQELAELQG